MVRLGKLASLRVKHLATPGAFLDGGELGDILLPGRYLPPGTIPGEARGVRPGVQIAIMDEASDPASFSGSSPQQECPA